MSSSSPSEDPSTPPPEMMVRFGNSGIPKPGANATELEKMEYTIACADHERLCLAHDYDALLEQRDNWKKKKGLIRGRVKSLELDIVELEEEVGELEGDKENMAKKLRQNVIILGMVEEMATNVDMISAQIAAIKDKLEAAISGAKTETAERD